MTTQTNASNVEILASWTGTGDYGFRSETRVVRYNGNTYVVADGYSGENSPRGGQCRPFVYLVPDHLAARAVELVSDGDGWDEERYNAPQRKIQLVTYEILADDATKRLGEVGNLPWTKVLDQ